MKKALSAVLIVSAVAIGFAVKSFANDDWGYSGRFGFKPDTLVVSRSVYEGTASTVTLTPTPQTLPLGCVAATIVLPTLASPPAPSTTNVAVTCATAVDNGEYPNTSDSHNVWNNAAADGSFGVTSPIFLDNITTDGQWLGTLPVPSDQIVTSFSSKSELALNRSLDGRSITFMGYRGGLGCPVTTFTNAPPPGKGLIGTPGKGTGALSPTAPNLLDVSNSNTPGVCDPTNPVVSSDPNNPTVPTAYYRAVAEVDDDGHIQITEGNAYSGNNGRAAFKAESLYYMTGNDNNGGLSSKSETPLQTGLTNTQVGVNLITSTGAELLVPGQVPPTPPNINMATSKSLKWVTAHRTSQGKTIIFAA